jgi:acetyl-CoA C-acetyltransferase
VLASEAAAARLDRQPLALIAGVALVGADPVDQFSGAVGAATRVLDAGGCRPAEVLRIELAEPFAAVVAAWAAGLGLDVASVNPDGGGIAIGEPTGATGAVLLAAVAHAVAGRPGGSGLAAMGGSGLGAAVLLRS